MQWGGRKYHKHYFDYVFFAIQWEGQEASNNMVNFIINCLGLCKPLHSIAGIYKPVREIGVCM